MHTPAERFLLQFHAGHAGATPRAFAREPVRCGDAVFADTYELLAAQVPDEADPVLDVACGDGYLLGVLAGRRPGRVLAGIDMSPDELAAAAARLQGRAELLQGRAQELPFAEGRFAAVASHMALMLMDETDAVLAALRRVLQPGGLLAGVVGMSMPGSLPLDAWRALLKPQLPPPDARVAIGDPRWRTEAALQAMLQAAGFDDVRIAPIEGELARSPEGMCEWFALMYDLQFVAPGHRAELLEAFLASLRAQAGPDGLVRMPLAWRLLVARKPR